MATSQIHQGQAQDGFAITPSDTLTLLQDSGNTKGYSIAFVHAQAGSGNVSVITADGTQLLVYILQGAVFPLAVRQVRATSTTATGLVALVEKQS